MHASECKRHADTCRKLARGLPPEHHALLFELAEKWIKAAEELEREQGKRTAGDAKLRKEPGAGELN
jgi:hypothetical protein